MSKKYLDSLYEFSYHTYGSLTFWISKQIDKHHINVHSKYFFFQNENKHNGKYESEKQLSIMTFGATSQFSITALKYAALGLLQTETTNPFYTGSHEKIYVGKMCNIFQNTL